MSNPFDPAPWGQNSGQGGFPQEGFPPAGNAPPVYSASAGDPSAQPTPTYPAPSYPAPPYDASGHPPAGYPPAQYPPPGYPGQFGPPPPTNGLAIAALVTSFVVAPLGIVLGHVALGQIKRRGEQGRGLAIGGLAVGYVFTLIAIIWIIATVVLVNSVSKDLRRYSSYTTTTTTTAPQLAPSESIADAINNSQVGGCLHVEETNGSVTVAYRTTCGSRYSQKKVVSRHPGTVNYSSYCPDNYIFTRTYNVLLCLTAD